MTDSEQLVLLRFLLTDELREKLLSEYARSLLKYPDNSFQMRRNGVTQELGETLQELAKYELRPTQEIWNRFEAEALQAIVTISRILVSCAPEKSHAAQSSTQESSVIQSRPKERYLHPTCSFEETCETCPHQGNGCSKN